MFRKSLSFVAALTLCCTAALTVSAIALSPDEAINSACPISGGPIDGESFVTHDGKKIGMCCGGCGAKFTAWDNDRKSNFVLTSLKTRITQDKPKVKTKRPAPTSKPAKKVKSDPYTLATCPISGGKLGSMGDAVVKTYEGREVRFCCAGCIGKFEANVKENFVKIDKQMIKQQVHYYPLKTCIITDETLVEGETVNYMYKNRLVRLCCTGCKKDFNKDAAKYLQKIDKAIVMKQRKNYPISTCVVAGGELGSMGGPVEIIAGTRLVRFCCKGCVPKFNKEPAKYVAMIDAAWKEKHADGDGQSKGEGKSRKEKGHEGHDHGHDHDH